jgi:hypothetical protein
MDAFTEHHTVCSQENSAMYLNFTIRAAMCIRALYCMLMTAHGIAWPVVMQTSWTLLPRGRFVNSLPPQKEDSYTASSLIKKLAYFDLNASVNKINYSFPSA